MKPDIELRLSNFKEKILNLRHSMVGYPCNQGVDYSPMYEFLNLTLNNVGDPFSGSNFRMNTHEFEREVLETFAKWLKAPLDGYWGYVNNGGTEGNMYGLYLARELLPNGIVYFSEDTHYSLTKLLRLIGARNIMIRGLPSGEMDYQDLYETLRIHRDRPPILFINIGTTMQGAIDDLKRIKGILSELAINRYYIHADAALSGVVLPFVEDPQAFNFADGIHSIAVSGHKLLGVPLPCGVVLALKENVDRIARSVEYVGVRDTTIMGSRNAITPLMLWYAIHHLGEAGIQHMIDRSIQLADYAIAKMESIGIKAWRHKNSMTVVFPRPSTEVLDRWQIAPYQSISHLITLPHVNEDIIDELVNDMKTFPSGDGV